MLSIEHDLYAPGFDSFEMQQTTDSHHYGPAGRLYTFDNAQGKGSYWAYFRDNLFAVNVFDMQFTCDGTMTYPHSEHLSIGFYESVHAEMPCAGKVLSPYTISTYIADEGACYHALYRCDSPLRGTFITVSPDYYRDKLQARFGNVPDIRHTFAAVDGMQDFHELIDLLKLARDYRGDGLAADLFYEGVVAEALALVIKRAQDQAQEDFRSKGVLVSTRDREIVGALIAHIETHLDGDLSCDALARRACMGQTKFKKVFRACSGMTPKAYVTATRMKRAHELLRDESLSIAQIARLVGYRKPGAFSEAFHRHTGIPPSSAR